MIKDEDHAKAIIDVTKSSERGICEWEQANCMYLQGEVKLVIS